MKFDRAGSSTVALLLAITTGALCSERPPLDPDPPPITPATTFAAATGLNVLECPIAESRSDSALLGPLGGILSVDGSSIELTLGDLLTPKLLILTVPASDYMEIDIRAEDVLHLNFNGPVSITIDYSRCPQEELDRGPLSVWHWDADTGAPLERMSATDDRASSKIRFETDHLSGYVVAN
ncbi:MAG: hypothetical protein ACRELV_02360 [Longimicrobiales bacterium]